MKTTTFGFWTRDGSVFVKGRKNDTPTRITDKGDIMSLFRNLAAPTGDTRG